MYRNSKCKFEGLIGRPLFGRLLPTGWINERIVENKEVWWYYIRISYVENKYVGTHIVLRLESVGKWSWVWEWIMMRLVLSDGRDFFGLGLCLPFLIWKFQTNLLWRLLMKFKCGSTLLYLLQGILPWAEIWADFFRLAVDLFLSFFQWDIMFFLC